MKRGLLGVFASLVCALSLGAGPAAAAPARQVGEQIDSYDVAISINVNNSIDVRETIIYDFGSGFRHGIERYIPEEFAFEGAKPDERSTYRRVTALTDFRASSSDAPADVNEITDKNNPGFTVFRIGDPNQTVSGKHTYVLTYRLDRVLNSFEGHDELFFNVVGTRWQVPIQGVTAAVSAPAPPTKVACYAGPEGSALPCSSAEIIDGAARFTNGPLAPGEGVSVVVALPKGAVDVLPPVLSEVWTVQSAFRPSPVSLAGGALLLVGGALMIGWLVWTRGRDRRFSGSATDAAFGNASGDEQRVPLTGGDVNPVEFVPPDGIRPGHMGTLWDEQANPLDVSAMIVDLAVRGWIRIDEVEPPQRTASGSGAGGDYDFVKLKAAAPPLKAEQTLLDGLFRDGPTIRLSVLKQHFAERLAAVESALYDDSVDLGWFPTRPDRVRARWHAIGLLVTVLGAGICALVAWRTHYGLLVLPLPILGLALLVLGGKFPHRTGRGTAMLGRVRGFKELFDVGEGERQRFMEQKQLFSEYLPYAIVFGCAEKWAETFAALGATPEEMGLGGWYTSPYAINPYMFGWAISSFSTSTAGSIAMATPSSTASSGMSGFSGGFSGGGFGGGGGGSW